MPTFRVHYKTRYRHLSQGGHHDYAAGDELSALRMFIEERRCELEDEEESADELPDPRNLSLSAEYSWWEGEYLVELRGVEPVDVVTCPLCDGIGEVPSSMAAQLPARKTL